MLNNADLLKIDFSIIDCVVHPLHQLMLRSMTAPLGKYHYFYDTYEDFIEDYNSLALT